MTFRRSVAASRAQVKSALAGVSFFAPLTSRMVDSPRWPRPRWSVPGTHGANAQKGTSPTLAIDPNQEFLVQPVDASWLQCNIECQEACPVGTNCRGYLNLAAEGRFEEGYILSREPNPVAAMCS